MNHERDTTRRWRSSYIVLIVTMLGCAETDYTNLTYDGYICDVGTANGFDPKGASEISYAARGYRDDIERFWQMKIERAAYDRLLLEMFENIEGTYPSLRYSKTDNPRVPTYWPQHNTPPSWWNLPASGELSCTRWEIPEQGWYWLYDSTTESAWIWHWRSQWYEYGWQRTERANAR